MSTPDCTPIYSVCALCGKRAVWSIELFVTPVDSGVDICRTCDDLSRNERRKRYKDHNRQYQQDHPEALRAYAQRKYYKNLQHSRQMGAARYQRRKARANALPASFSGDDWMFALSYFEGRCAVCGRPPGLWHTLARDHWIPVTKGGSYTPDNIVPLCHSQKDGDGSCNNSKHDRDAHEWLVEKFGKRKAAQIEQRINQYFALMKVRRADGNPSELSDTAKNAEILPTDNYTLSEEVQMFGAVTTNAAYLGNVSDD